MESITRSTSLALACHPRTRSHAIRRVEAAVSWTAEGSLSVAFALEGDFTALRIPESRPSRRADNLWQHTCFEAFVMAGEGPGYREYNYSPSGEWAVYDFRGYRDGDALQIELAPGIVTHPTLDRLQLNADIGPACLPPGRSLQLGLAAVVEGMDGVLSYWALRHPPGRPDFHHTGSFAVRLEQP